MNTKRYDFSFKLFYFVYIGAVGAFVPYINVYLENSRGLSGSQIGLINAIGLIVGVCVAPLWGVIGDKTRKYNAVLKLIICLTLGSLYFYSKAMVYPTIVVAAIMLEISRIGGMPMADTQATNFTAKIKGNYGAIRGMGSAGYMLASMLVGFLADAYGLDGPLFATYAALLVMAFAASFGFPKDEPVKTDTQTKEKKTNKNDFIKLLTNKKFLFILLIAILSSTVIDTAMTYSGNHVINTLGGSGSTISWLTMIQVLPEVAFLMFASRIIDKIGYKKYYIIALGASALRFAIYAFIPNQYAFLIGSIVHCINVGCSTVATLSFIRFSVDNKVLATAITLLNVTLNLGKAIYGYAFGLIYEHLGSTTIFVLAFAVLVFVFVLILMTKQFNEIDKATLTPVQE